MVHSLNAYGWTRLSPACLAVAAAMLAPPALAQTDEGVPLDVREIRPPRAKPTLLFDLKDVYGTYYFGDGLGVNCSLSILPDNRFTFAWHGCMGEYDRNSGRWELDGDVLELKPEQENVSRGFQGVNVRFIPVKIGETEYLVDEHEMPGFCASLNSDDRPLWRHGSDYVKSEISETDIKEDAPVIPVRYRHFYEKGAVEAKVERIDENGNAVLNKGSNDRLAPKMRLEFNGFEASIELVVLSVSENDAVAKPQYYWNSGSCELKVGAEFTTGGYWHRPRGTGFERFDGPPPIEGTCCEEEQDGDD